MITIEIGGVALVSFVDAPAAAADFLRHQYHVATPSSASGQIVATFEDRCPRRPRALFTEGGAYVIVDEAGRLCLSDVAGYSGELPEVPVPTAVRIDARIDPTSLGALHQVADRLVEVAAAAEGMLLLKGAAVALPEATLALVGFAGSGKSSILLHLLGSHVGYLAEERLVLCGPRSIAALRTPLRLSLGRRYRLSTSASSGLRRRDRALLAAAPRALSVLPSPLRTMVARSLAQRWVDVDVERAFPGVAMPERATLDAIVFLERSPHGVELEPIDAVALARRAGAHIRYLDDVSWSTLRAAHASAAEDDRPWPPVPDLEQRLYRLPEMLEGVGGWVARVGPDVHPASVASEIRAALTVELPRAQP